MQHTSYPCSHFAWLSSAVLLLSSLNQLCISKLIWVCWPWDNFPKHSSYQVFSSLRRTGWLVLKCPIVIYKASRWDCDDFYVGKAKRRWYERKTEHFKQQVIDIINRILRITSGQLVTPRLIGKGASWLYTIYIYIFKETLCIGDLQPTLTNMLSS